MSSEFGKATLKKRYPEMKEAKKAMFAGALAGICSLVVVVPMDLLKIRA